MGRTRASRRIDWLFLPLAICLAVATGNLALTYRPAAASAEPAYRLDRGRQPSLPVEYWIDCAFTGEQNEAIRAAFASWQDVPGSPVSFVYAGVRIAGGRGEDDGLVTVVRSPQPLHQPADGVIAQAVRTRVGTGHRRPYDYRDTDIVLDFSGRVTWSSDDATGTQDLQSVVVHEVGHVLGLEHVGDPTQAMYRYVERRTAWRRLPADGDLEGILAAYPNYPVRPRPFGGAQLLR